MKKNLVKLIAITLAAVMLLSIAGVVAERYIVSNTLRLPAVKSRPVETPVVVEEPVAEEPVVVEEPAVEEPAVEEPVVEEPAVEEPTVEEPVVEEPVVEEPVVEEPAVEEPVVEEPVVEEPAVEEPVVEEPAVEEPIVEEPVEEEPAFVAPELKLHISSNLTADSIVVAGTEMVLTLTVEGAEGYEYKIQWQVTEDGVTWTDLPGETGHSLSIILAPHHTGMSWRANVEIIAPVK